MNRYSLIIFDLDGTLIDDTVYIWKTLHEAFETDPVKRKKAHEDYLGGRIDYAQWAYNDLELLKSKGVKKSDIVRLFQSLHLVPHARETLLALRQKNYRMAVISGSVDLALFTALPEAQSLFEDIFINSFRFDSAGNLVDIIPTPFDMEHKAAGLKFLANKYNIVKERMVFVGDNENDIHIAREAGLSIAFNSKSPKLDAVSSLVIPGNDLKKILTHIL